MMMMINKTEFDITRPYNYKYNNWVLFNDVYTRIHNLFDEFLNDFYGYLYDHTKTWVNNVRTFIKYHDSYQEQMEEIENIMNEYEKKIIINIGNALFIGEKCVNIDKYICDVFDCDLSLEEWNAIDKIIIYYYYNHFIDTKNKI
jgi:hypothetical protein